MGDKIQILEVGLRDGLQNLKQYIPIEEKLKLVEGLIRSGIKHIQHTSFVNPKLMPQFVDAAEITEILLKKYPGFDFIPLVPNYYGACSAYEVGIRKITYVISLSESHNRENINRTHEESFIELQRIMKSFEDLVISVDVATTFGCPFEGKFSTDKVVEFIDMIIKMGIKTITLADTIGVANPKQVREIVSVLKRVFPNIEFRVHIHDTRNMGMSSTLAAIESGIINVDASLGGLGGCPFAPTASGNISTEDLVYMLNNMGYDTGIDYDKLLEIANYAKRTIEGNYSGHNINIASKSKKL